MSRAAGLRDPSLLIITVAGFAATIAQVLLLREFLVLFHGNEMSTALALAGWLLWTALGSAVAARSSSRSTPKESTLGLLLTLLALALPALVLMVRGARAVFAIPAGELVPVGKMVWVCLSVPALFGVISGALFGLCWAYRRLSADDSWARPLSIYLGEAAGAAGGGIVFFFLLLRVTTPLFGALAVALLPLAAAAWILWRLPRERRLPIIRLFWSLAALVLVVQMLAAGRLEDMSRRWQWGRPPALALDTPFHNIAILQQTGQVTVFTNGLWLFTVPDPASVEPVVHTALLQHPEPRRVLLIGGGLAGQVIEALKHPSVAAIDYVEQDPALIAESERFLDPRVLASLRDHRVQIRHEDAATFLRRKAGLYDVILMNTGDPINAQMNRFFTVEMFRRLEGHLLPGGLLTFSVPGGGDVIGPIHARFLSSLHRTLREVFPEVALLPGERARFFAARDPGSLVLDPTLLAEQIAARRLELQQVRADTLQDLMSPFRLDYVQSILREFGSSPVNRQLTPICYLHALNLWAAQWHPGLERVLGAAASARPVALATGVATLGSLVVLFFWLGRPRYRVAVGASVLVQGAVGMVLQVVLILTFQILEGFAYLQLALLIAMFMAGLAAGTLWVSASGIPRKRRQVVGWFAGLQVGVAAYPLLLLTLFSPDGQRLLEALAPSTTAWVFSTASFVAGLLGGAHFSLASLATGAAGGRLETAGGYLYAADLAGAAGGAFAAGLVVLPLYGVANTLMLLSMASLVCLLAILRRPR